MFSLSISFFSLGLLHLRSIIEIDRRTQVVYVGSTGDSIPCCFRADFVCLLPCSISLVPKVFSVRVALL